jgi:predicted histone-like DNA-binding protein
MKYKVVKKVNPRNPNGPKRKTAVAVNAGKMTTKALAKEIAGRSSLTQGDMENALSNCLDELPTFLKIGMSIQLGNFGTLRLNPVCECVDEDQPFTAANIKGVKVIFVPSPDLKNALKDISFEELKQ